MQISATTSIQPTLPVDRTTTSAQAQAQVQAKSPETEAKVKAVDTAATQPKVFTPAPPLRPNIQDYVDIDRTLIQLRQGA